MKNALTKRCMTFLLAIIMVMGLAVPAFAAEVKPADEVAYQAENVAEENESGIMPLNTTGKMVIPAGTNSEFVSITLDPYIGFTKKFRIVTSCSNNDGILTAHLVRKSDGKVMSNDWYVDPNGNAVWSFTLPSSGEYRLTVSSIVTTADVYVTCYWE